MWTCNVCWRHETGYSLNTEGLVKQWYCKNAECAELNTIIAVVHPILHSVIQHLNVKTEAWAVAHLVECRLPGARTLARASAPHLQGRGRLRRVVTRLPDVSFSRLRSASPTPLNVSLFHLTFPRLCPASRCSYPHTKGKLFVGRKSSCEDVALL